MQIEETKRAIFDYFEKHADAFINMSDQIWAKPEIYWEETFAMQLQSEYLKSQGFTITGNAGGQSTGFIAEWGNGTPIIGFIGEYDALPGLSQAAEPVKKPITEGAPGHGCGHNLLGMASVAGVMATKTWMETNDVNGTVRYYGTPAEEMGGGKVFMARDGLFDDLDAALTYHPSYINMASKATTVAIVSSKFLFHGKTSHAGGAPHLGRSALDAVELMNVGANYMREHVLDGTRIQYVITNGGQAANIVPETAEVHYILRAANPVYLLELADRLRNIAKGAALMTDTTYQEKPESGYANVLNNPTLTDLIHKSLVVAGPIEFTDEEMAFAQKMADAFPESNVDFIEQKIETFGLTKQSADLLRQHADKPLLGAIFPAIDEGVTYKGATDVGDLSQVAPSASLNTATFPTCSPGHSWINTACSGMSIGHKGMLLAAKVLALTAAELLSDASLVKKIRADFKEQMAGRTYQPLIPEDMQPEK